MLKISGSLQWSRTGVCVLQLAPRALALSCVSGGKGALVLFPQDLPQGDSIVSGKDEGALSGGLRQKYESYKTDR